MKSIANQYRDLQEGRMSQFNFMRNLRMSMPQVTNTTSFGDAVKILKNKGIITENLTNEGQSEWMDKFRDALGFDESTPENLKKSLYTDQHNLMDKYGNMSPEEAAKKWLEANKTDESLDNFDEAVVLSKEEFEPETEETSDEDAEFDAILKQLEDEMYGERATKSDVLDEPLEEEQLNENQEVKATDENFEEVTTGIEVEHDCYPDWSYEEVLKFVRKNLKKNPNYYTNYKLTGIRDYEIETMGNINPDDRKMKFYTEKTAVDTAMGMKKVKMPKKEEKKKLKEQVEEAEMRFKDLPADPEKYKIIRDSKGYIIKATNSDGVEFQKGDEVTTYDGEKIKIAKFEESQGKVKAIYNAGMFFRGIDIDGLEAPKATFRPGVNIGGSFEKFKSKLAEMVREAIAEMYDGRDNIDAEIED